MAPLDFHLFTLPCELKKIMHESRGARKPCKLIASIDTKCPVVQRNETNNCTYQKNMHSDLYSAQANRCYAYTQARKHGHESTHARFIRREKLVARAASSMTLHNNIPFNASLFFEIDFLLTELCVRVSVHEKTWANNVALKHYACEQPST